MGLVSTLSVYAPDGCELRVRLSDWSK